MSGPSKVPIGGPLKEFPGRSFNLLVQEWYRQHGNLGRNSNRSGGPGQCIVCKARNVSGATIQYGNALAIEGLAIAYDSKENQQYQRPLLKAQKNTAALNHATMGVALTSIENNKPGPFIITGLAWVRCNFTDEDHHFVTLEDEQEDPIAVSSTDGYPILDSEEIPDPEYLPAELWVLVLLGGGGGDNYRLIRGQSVGAQSGSTILIDNVWVLSGGLDPSSGNPATQVTVYNIFGQSYADNELIDAVYSPGVMPTADWETLKTATGTDKYRLIRGLATAAVAASATTLSIDNIVVLSGGLDPRTTPGDMAETLLITNSQKEAFTDNEPVLAIYREDTGGWQTLVVERYRAIRGNWYSGTSTILIDSIVALDSGLDPRSNPADAAEQVSVTRIVTTDVFTSGDKVWADWSVANNRWEARPRIATPQNLNTYVCALGGSISAGSTSAMATTSGTVYQINSDGTLTSLGSRSIYNPFTLEVTPWTGELFVCHKFSGVPGTDDAGDKYVLAGQHPVQRLASLSGFGNEKSLYSDGTDDSNIKWGQEPCT